MTLCWGQLKQGILKHCASIAPTKERAQSVDFSDVYYTGSQSIVYRTGDEYTDFSELTGKTIAVLEGSQSDLIASGRKRRLWYC